MKHFFVFFALAIYAGSALSADLSSNIMRRVQAANQYLESAEDQISTGRAEFAGRNVKGAREEYANIARYYNGSYDPAHPTLAALEARIKTVSAKLESARVIPPPTALTQSAPPASEQKAKTSSTSAAAGKPSELISNVRRMIGIIDRHLTEAKKDIARGNSADHNIGKARGAYKTIFTRYTGLFDPNHPDIIGVKARIDAMENTGAADSMARMGSEPVESGHTIVGMSANQGKKLSLVGVHLSRLDEKLANARKAEASAAKYSTGGPKLSTLAGHTHLIKGESEQVERLFSEFNRDFAGQNDPNHPAYVQVRNRVTKARQDVAAFMSDVDTEARTVQKESDRKYHAKIQAIMGKYKNVAPTGKLHAANPGRIVWATREIALGAQDAITTRDTFKLSDPIFGRVFLHQSLGNTPVYSSNGGSPSESLEFNYEFRLFIDGKEFVDTFNAFSSGKLNGEAGQSWTTWQFAPNPVPFDDGFKNEADAWRKTTRILMPGKHKVRFELWSVQGQLKSREPVSIGEFTLLVDKGDRIKAGTTFPADTHAGGDTNEVRAAMKKALDKSGAETPVKIAVTSDWQQGVYQDTRRGYRTVSGAIMWNDTDNDGVCRFTTYNFVSDHLGGDNWAQIKFKSFCLSCPEGDVECSK